MSSYFERRFCSNHHRLRSFSIFTVAFSGFVKSRVDSHSRLGGDVKGIPTARNTADSQSVFIQISLPPWMAQAYSCSYCVQLINTKAIARTRHHHVRPVAMTSARRCQRFLNG
eukprot:scaffold5333_cov74-Cylindrotheca_fusiformis.AAC.3